jgi:hypothetical protein
MRKKRESLSLKGSWAIKDGMKKSGCTEISNSSYFSFIFATDEKEKIYTQK